ncbi:MAG: hypothetical protein WBX01_04570 [Nitrososphaeraceae archaeon]|jgi:hypothetical protein
MSVATFIITITFSLILSVSQTSVASGSNACPPGYSVDESGECRSETQYGIPDNQPESAIPDNQSSTRPEIVPEPLLVPDAESAEVNLEIETK